MIRKKTVFVLGAGASKPYGFPTGIELTSSILAQMNPGHAMYTSLMEAGFEPSQLDSFRQAFESSGRFSIDAFLQFRPDHSEVGRAAIAFRIISAEDRGALFSRPVNVDWYRLLIHTMNAPVLEFKNNAVSFVTFNYDRSLQFYLTQHLIGAYGLQRDAATAIITHFPFIHLHGDVGPLPGHGEVARDYKSEVPAHEIRQWSKRIHIVHDELAEREANFQRAKDEIAQADRVLLLGIGFDSINMRRLEFDKPGKYADATSYGLTGMERKAVTTFTQSRLKLHDMDCLTLLRERVQLE